jgi:hypothetical protein
MNHATVEKCGFDYIQILSQMNLFPEVMSRLVVSVLKMTVLGFLTRMDFW